MKTRRLIVKLLRFKAMLAQALYAMQLALRIIISRPYQNLIDFQEWYFRTQAIVSTI